MQVLGVVAEYNPFHNGHLYHLQAAKKSTQTNHTIVVMSPNFVQRGAPAITDKWTRTKMALLSGTDLVIELPTPYAVASAEFFSHASISLLNHTGIVDTINFGSETSNLNLLSEIATILVLEPKAYKELLKNYLDLGISFPSARARALVDYAHTVPEISSYVEEIKPILDMPNNILAIEYLKALKKLNSSMIPSTIQRKGSDYHNENLAGLLPSATAIRNKISEGHQETLKGTMPQSSYDLLYPSSCFLQNHVKYEDLSFFLCYRLLFSSARDLQNIMGINEGMENRILSTFKTTQYINEMTLAIKSKRYTQTAVQRMLMNIILQITKEDFYTFQGHGGPQYIRVLGFKKSSSYLLSQLKDKATLPLVMNVKKDYKLLSPLAKKMLDIEIRSTNIYASLQSSKNNYNLDFTHPLVII